MSSLWKCSVMILLVVSAGCANVRVKKVPLDKRAEGTDAKLEGFRYYLGRPYIVVKERIPVSSESELMYLVRYAPKNPPKGVKIPHMLALVPLADPRGDRPMLDLNGAPLPQAWQKVRNDFEPVAKGSDATLKTITWQNDITKFDGDPSASDIEALLQTRIQVAMLPDFEEQYRIKNINCLAHSKYKYSFANGWALTSATGSYDSTEVAVRLLQSLSKVIDSARKISNARTEARGSGSPRTYVEAGRSDLVLVAVARTQYVMPGVYKLLKSWERAACNPHHPQGGCGILGDMGLPVITQIEVGFAEKVS